MNPDTSMNLLYSAISVVHDGKAAEIEVVHEYEEDEAGTCERVVITVRDEVHSCGPVFVQGDRVDEEG